jgi:hypothetical protein
MEKIEWLWELIYWRLKQCDGKRDVHKIIKSQEK